MSVRIKSVTVDWNEGYINRPTFDFAFDRAIDDEQLLFKIRDRIVLGVDGEAARFNSITDSPSGYGGASFDFTVRHPDVRIERKENVGAWSSRAGVVNALFEQQVVGSAFKAVTLEGLVRWVRDNPGCGFGVAKVRRLDEIYYEPTDKDGNIKPGEAELLEIIV